MIALEAAVFGFALRPHGGGLNEHPLLKPRRGGLFISASSPSTPSFCFSAARIRRIRTKLVIGGVSASALRYSLSRAADKQKERSDVWTLAISVGLETCAPIVAARRGFVTLG